MSFRKCETTLTKLFKLQMHHTTPNYLIYNLYISAAGPDQKWMTFKFIYSLNVLNFGRQIFDLWYQCLEHSSVKPAYVGDFGS